MILFYVRTNRLRRLSPGGSRLGPDQRADCRRVGAASASGHSDGTVSEQAGRHAVSRLASLRSSRWNVVNYAHHDDGSALHP